MCCITVMCCYVSMCCRYISQFVSTHLNFLQTLLPQICRITWMRTIAWWQHFFDLILTHVLAIWVGEERTIWVKKRGTLSRSIGNQWKREQTHRWQWGSCRRAGSLSPAENWGSWDTEEAWRRHHGHSSIRTPPWCPPGQGEEKHG